MEISRGGGGGSQKPYFFKESMTLKWNFRRGGEIQTKKPSVGGVWIFSGTINTFSLKRSLEGSFTVVAFTQLSSDFLCWSHLYQEFTNSSNTELNVIIVFELVPPRGENISRQLLTKH